MATIDVTRTYVDGNTLNASDIDAFLDDIESFLNTTKLSDDNIQDAGITASTKLVNASINAAKIAASAVETAKINDLAVTTAKINDLAVTTAKINDLAVTTGKVNDLAITTGKLADASVTQAKRAALGQQISSSCGSFNTTSTTYVNVTNLSVTITTTGRPVWIGLVGDSTGGAYIGAFEGNDEIVGFLVAIRRDGSIDVSGYESALRTKSGETTDDPILRMPSSIVNTVDIVAAGTYTYTIRLAASQAGNTAELYNSKLLVFEL